MCESTNLIMLIVVFLLCTLVECRRYSSGKSSTDIPDEKWGYVTVRPKAHMFWWSYGAQNKQARSNLPLILWLQGGPGGSGAGFGNFLEIGPLDVNLKPRNTTWLTKANVLFIDNPVGAGFSYVDDPKAFTTNVSQIAEDLFVIFSNILEQIPAFKQTPFFIFCESYGGKMTAAFGERLYEAIKRKKIECNFKGVALGDSWISPVDSVLTWGSYLYQFNLLDGKDLHTLKQISQSVASAVKNGDFLKATRLWAETEDLIDKITDYVNVYNVLQHDSPSSLSDVVYSEANHMSRLYGRHVAIYQQRSLAQLMDGQIRHKLRIIPHHVKWSAQSGEVFGRQALDFMKPVIKTVSKLISHGLKVVVFQGQLDMICDTPGAEIWIKKLDWSKLENFLATSRKPLYVGKDRRNTQAFVKTYDNFSLYYIMNAGHMVPLDNGPMALEMVGLVIK